MLNRYRQIILGTFLVPMLIFILLGATISLAFGSEMYVFVKKWGSSGVDNGQFDQPHGVDIGSSDKVYVADTSNNRIQTFDANGNFITKWGSVCSISTNDQRCIDPDGVGPLALGDGQFAFPSDVAVQSSNVYVADQLNHRIQKFDSNGNFITKWGSEGSMDGQFVFPYAIAVDSSGKVFVAELINDRIQKFDSNGNFITKWGSQGSGDGQFNHPRGIAIDSLDNVYVVDGENNRIQKFDNDGNLITTWGSTPGSGTDDGQLGQPFGIDLDSSNSVYVANTGFDRIEKFSADGTFIANWGSSGSGDGELKRAKGVAVDSSGNVYVADTQNYRIQVFSQVSDNVPLNVTLDDEAICQDVSATRKGISVSFIIKGLYHLDNTYKSEVRGPDGNIVIDESNGLPVSDNLSPSIPRDAPNPATLFLGKSFATQKFGTFTFIVSGSDGSKSTLPFAVPQCPPADNSPPDTRIISATDGDNNDIQERDTTSSDSITFQFEGTDDIGIQGFSCILDGGSPVACSSPKNYGSVQDGNHEFSVFAIDASSNQDPTPASISWTVDTAAPIVSVPSDITVESTSSSGAVVTFSTTAHDNIDGDITPVCTPPSGTTFPVGNTNVNCDATDNAGNTGTASFNILVKQSQNPGGEPTSLSLKINPNRGVAAGHDFSLSGRLFNSQSRPMSFAGLTISFMIEPSAITIPSVQTDKQGKFSVSGLKAPIEGSYEIVAHFAGTTLLKASESSPVLLKVEKPATSLRLEIKGNPSSGASLAGVLIDTSTGKGITNQIISFTTDRSGLIIHDANTDSKGKYKALVPPLECGTGAISIQSHFAGNNDLKPSDSKTLKTKIPACPTRQTTLH